MRFYSLAWHRLGWSVWIMYAISTLGLTVVAPVLSVLIELLVSGGSADPMLLVGKWFTFWAGGVRLFVAGLSQVFRPDFTAKNILGVASGSSTGSGGAGVNQVVQELGFANLSIGLIGILSLLLPGWLVPAALAGGLFYAFAGARHISKPHKNAKEMIATVTDLFVAAALLAYVVYALLSGAM